MKITKGIRVSAIVAAAISGGAFAHGADGTWTNGNGGSWGTTSSWLSSIIADGADSTANFGTLNITADRTITLNSARTIGNLIFGDTSPNFNWTLTNGGDGANILTLERSSGTPTITVNNQTATISLELAGSNGMTKAGGGILVLTAANSYSGTTTISGGTLTLGSGGSLNSASALAIAGNGVFNFSGAAAATQTVNGLEIFTGMGTVNNTVAGTTLSLGDITRTGNGMLNFTNTTGNINTTAANLNGMIGTWATIGSGTSLDYAVSNGGGVAISSLGAATVLPSAGPGDASTNYTLAAGQTQTADTVGNTLRYTGGAGALALGSSSLSLNGLMNAGTGLLTVSGTAGNPGLVTNGNLDIVTNTGGITISSVISGNGSLSIGGVGTVVGASPTGLVTLSGVNTYLGGTIINSGAVRASNTSAFGSGAITVASGAQVQTTGGNYGNTFNLNGGSAMFIQSGNNIFSGTVNLESNAGLAIATNNNTVVDFAGTLNLGENTFSISTNGNSGVSANISGGISGTGGITKSNAGTLNITGDNTATWSGTMTQTGGVLAIGNNGALGTATYVWGVNDNNVTVRSTDTTTRTLANAMTMTGNGNSIFIFGSTGAGTNGDLAFTGNVSFGGANRRFVVYNRTDFDGVMSAAGNFGLIMQTGTGTLALNGANTYTGATTVNAGTLLVNGSIASSSGVSVASGATLGGTGTASSISVASGGSLAPGDGGIGTLSATSATLASGSILKLEINTGAGTSDRLNLSGAFNLAAADDTILELSLVGTDVLVGTTFTLVDYDSWNGELFTYLGDVLLDDSIITLGLNQFQFSYNGVDGFTSAITMTAVPEPSTYLLLGIGGLALFALRRRAAKRS